jgi:GH18 family chitinase
VDGKVSCTCKEGYEGNTCETNIDDCAKKPCQNGGVCKDGVASYTCKCADGFTGETCETNIDDCAKKPCQNGGTCVDGIEGYTCECPDGYGGKNCETPLASCDPNPCENGGSCSLVNGKANCKCAPGYEGPTCETDIDECKAVPSPCDVNASCTNTMGSYGCKCNDGYSGDGKNCKKDDEPELEPVVVGYFPNWGVYWRHYYAYTQPSAEDAGVVANYIPAPYYTHIQLAFVNIGPDGTCIAADPGIDFSSSQSQDSGWGPVSGWKSFGAQEGVYADLKALRAVHPNVKLLLSVGGWTYSQNFSDVAATPAARKKFVDSCVDYMKEHGFDGLDLDWEYPGIGGKDGGNCAVGKDPCSYQDKLDATILAGDNKTFKELDPTACVTCRPEDAQNYVLLLKKFRETLDNEFPDEHHTLTVAVGAAPKHIEKMDLAGMHPYLDWIGIMTYDFYGAWGNKTAFNSPFDHNPAYAGEKGWSYKEAIENFMNGGVPANKLVAGMAYYGRGWHSAKSHEVGGAAVGPGGGDGSLDAKTSAWISNQDGKVWGVWEAGVWSYRYLAENLLDPKDPTKGINGYVRYWDELAECPYLYNEADGIWIGYDDAESLKVKAEYAKSLGLRGALIWDVSFDNCGDDLAKAVNEGLERTVVDPPEGICGDPGKGDPGGPIDPSDETDCLDGAGNYQCGDKPCVSAAKPNQGGIDDKTCAPCGPPTNQTWWPCNTKGNCVCGE